MNSASQVQKQVVNKSVVDHWIDTKNNKIINTKNYKFISSESRVNYLILNKHGTSSSHKCDGGGTKKKHEKGKIDRNRSLPVENITTQKVGRQVDINEEVKKKLAHYPNYPQFRPGISVDPDLIFNPENATMEDIRQAMIRHPNLDLCGSPGSTLDTTIKVLARMTVHPFFPVDLTFPSQQQFNRYLDACMKYGDTNKKTGKLEPIGENGRNHRIKAWRRYLVILGVDKLWSTPPIKEIKTRKEHVRIFLPEEVNQWFIHGNHVQKRDMRRFKNKNFRKREVNLYIQYLYWFGFITGLAPEKEWIDLTIENLYFDIKRCAHLNVARPKIGHKKRTLNFNYTESSSHNHKSFRNFLHVRSKFARKVEKALIVNPFDGDKWTEGGLRTQLSKYGKRIDPNFQPYWLRYWCGTQRLIDLGETDKALAKVSAWLGHSLNNKGQTVKYTEFALLNTDRDGVWFDRAFKQHFKRNAGRQHGLLLPQQTSQNAFDVAKLYSSSNGPAEI